VEEATALQKIRRAASPSHEEKANGEFSGEHRGFPTGADFQPIESQLGIVGRKVVCPGIQIFSIPEQGVLSAARGGRICSLCELKQV
jgi:hypothetical protein